MNDPTDALLDRVRRLAAVYGECDAAHVSISLSYLDDAIGKGPCTTGMFHKGFMSRRDMPHSQALREIENALLDRLNARLREIRDVVDLPPPALPGSVPYRS